ncbi:hypothetical protein BDV26DRAFT_267760 [Aspergillus bertholletiae]|uniref:Uncharacterized protein n=1 Tax=Aspergillus bertholletiae TaxID=1226010 RepID=A0A5N7B2E5_9EURO|nr:hypothetical protein BDV26DRAFT_267760 [Aspergillus bertholletiae]
MLSVFPCFFLFFSFFFVRYIRSPCFGLGLFIVHCFPRIYGRLIPLIVKTCHLHIHI